MKKTKLFLPVVLLTLVLVLGAGIVRASTFGSVEGKVTDAAGHPLAGVKISLDGGGTATTDKSGSYTLEGIDPGLFKLQATKKGYETTSVDVTITQDVPQELDITLSPAAVPASGS